jgi:NADPH:quinone reductase-like Zn-dependent oxidoreductase
MKAVVLTRFGPPEVLQVQEIAKPVPKDNEILIQVHATTVSAGDNEMRGLKVPLVLGLLFRIYIRFLGPKPMILGQEVAGEIEAVGAAVTRFKPGDQVFGWTSLRMGAYAEYICLSEKGVLALKPAGLSYEEAAPFGVGGLEAVYFLQKADLQPGAKVLIYGAGGSIGTFAVQLARHWGAEVTAVDRAEKLGMLRALGADHVIDSRREDFTKNGVQYDVIFDVIGKTPFARSLRSLRPNGRYLVANPRLAQRILGRWVERRSNKRVLAWASRAASEYREDLEFLKELIAAGQIKTVIDKAYPLEQAAEAHRYVETGRKKGNVIITVAQSS